MIIRLFISTGLALVFSGIVHAQRKKDIDDVYRWMTGTFSSEVQARADSSFFHIRLTMTPIWKDRKGEYWLYVEQAEAGNLARPYRQRIYQLVTTARGIESRVYTFDHALAYAGKPESVESLTPDQLMLRAGCEVILKRRDAKAFVGATEGKDCASELRGAAYATSEVLITPEYLITWDQGFDASGNQVWGSTKGGYRFDRIK